MIRAIPANLGVGFFSMERQPQYAELYREEQVGRYWNYYVTPKCFLWPKKVTYSQNYLIDGFAPNLNKSLHVGHLRQLTLASSLSKILGKHGEFVALLGASQGVHKYAVNELNDWFDFADYHPALYYDVLMPQDVVNCYKKKMPYKDVCRDMNGNPFETEQECTVWDGPKGVEHFDSLGLKDKHLPMGLVLGSDNKKMKSRNGDGVTAKEILEQIKARLEPTSKPDELAWNIVAWNFLHVARSKNVKYSPEEWTKPDAPGLYISYTYARLMSAINQMPPHPDNESGMWLGKFDWKYPQDFAEWAPKHLNQSDAELVGFAYQYSDAMQRSIDSLDPVILANYAHDLAKKLNLAYHSEKIKDGRPGFQFAIIMATAIFGEVMKKLGMFTLEQV